MKLYIVCYLLSLLTQCLYGANDHQSWTKVSLEKKIPYSLKLELSQGLRLKDQLSTFNQTFFEASLSYKDSNGLRINIPYRYTIFENKIKHRLSFGASYQYSFKPVSLKYRMKYYRLFENGEPIGEDGEAIGDLIRIKFTINYKSGKKTNPYIAGELFHLLNTNNNPLDEYRASFGVEIDLPRKNSINFFYILKKEDITKSSPDEINVFGLSYISKI
jgi:hypothetical protein